MNCGVFFITAGFFSTQKSGQSKTSFIADTECLNVQYCIEMYVVCFFLGSGETGNK